MHQALAETTQKDEKGEGEHHDDEEERDIQQTPVPQDPSMVHRRSERMPLLPQHPNKSASTHHLHR